MTTSISILLNGVIQVDDEMEENAAAADTVMTV